ncbi:RAMP superfamily CRISPR-associated protein [Nakamurella multipartita]|uniref:CRISPR type III-associated protein domain-containing protein n=1 Tax=Nakamurella multipartita (strain ATCC 700099 / DSM 44233 / CIP 104796 / JCM 9543 / NBRC 105858 / Y-104) TaxID=479431 RepID=C8XDG9_NAKMY|nr:RAMP superfamily CRISPR-associated protein [Nakamurella multipartita]ACV77633.1 protein of unknown function DUF324 [Nakamurella multipartita DSM 44233]
MSTITLIRVDGTVDGPWAIGSGEAGQEINQAMLVDERTQAPVLPSTTLAGALRAHLGEPSASDWLGPDSDASDEQGKPLSATSPSRLWALGAITTAGRDDARLERRTAIDPQRGAAGGQTLRTEHVVDVADPDRSSFRWVLQHDGAIDLALLDRLADWSCAIGARQTLGLGRMRVSRVEAITLNLSEARQLTWWLTQRAEWLREPAGQQNVESPEDGPHEVRCGTATESGYPVFSYLWRIVDPLHVGTPSKGGDDVATAPDGGRIAQLAPLRRSRTVPGAAEVPGSAWKGVFRHRCEFILRACGAGEDQIAAVVGVLFGASGEDGPGRRRGLLVFDRSTVVAPPDAVTSRSHVAIDRISGGAADGLLYRIESVDRGELTLTVRSFAQLPAPVGNLLDHVVRDLHDGVVGIGGSTTRGYGTIAVTGDPPTPGPVDLQGLGTFASTVLNSAKAPA